MAGRSPTRAVAVAQPMEGAAGADLLGRIGRSARPGWAQPPVLRWHRGSGRLRIIAHPGRQHDREMHRQAAGHHSAFLIAIFSAREWQAPAPARCRQLSGGIIAQSRHACTASGVGGTIRQPSVQPLE